MNDNSPLNRTILRPVEIDRGLTLHETADILSYHYTTIYRMVRAGELESYGKGKKLRVYESSIHRYRQQTSNTLNGMPKVRDRVRTTGPRFRRAMNELEALLH